MAVVYSEEEDITLVKGYRQGLSDREIVTAMSEAGFFRTIKSVVTRRCELGFRRDRAFSRRDVLCREEAIIDDNTDYIVADRAFCAALREHHAERETALQKA